MTDQPIEPMTDEVVAWWKERVTTNLWDRDVLSLMARLDAEIARANAAEAEAALWRTRAAAAVSKLPDDMRLGDLHEAVAEMEKIKAERDAALARAMPAPVKMETVEQVEACERGFYRVAMRPGSLGRLGLSPARRGVLDLTMWFCDGHNFWRPYGVDNLGYSGAVMVGAWIVGPLPDIPIPTSEEG